MKHVVLLLLALPLLPVLFVLAALEGATAGRFSAWLAREDVR